MAIARARPPSPARIVQGLALGCTGAAALACFPAISGPPPAVVTTTQNFHVR